MALTMAPQSAPSFDEHSAGFGDARSGSSTNAPEHVTATATPAILEMQAITKTFPGVIALNKVSFAVRAGEIHALVGENGAGKSTLMKVLSGVYPHGSYDGKILFEGKECAFKSIRDSEARGIIIIHQELALVPLLSIAENVFLGHEPASAIGVIDTGTMHQRTAKLLAKVGLREAPSTLITNLGVGKQQLVEIAKALAKDVKLLILDEPTASLNENDSEALLALLLEFKAQGLTSIIISHKLNEISKVADTITILRDGATVETFKPAHKSAPHIDAPHNHDTSHEAVCAVGAPSFRAHGSTEARIIRGMVGREITDRFPKRQCAIGEPYLEISNWHAYHPLHRERAVVNNISMHVRRGEVVGIAGLMGAGRTEFAMSVFGRSYGVKISGTARINGKTADISTIEKAIANGIAYVTEDRKQLGLILGTMITHNLTLANLKPVSKNSVINEPKEIAVANDYKKSLNIRCASVAQDVVNLSGGNQQKVVLSKWLFAEPDILILDEPTRGIDVGAKYEIYTIMNTLAEQGKCVILISSEMPELLGTTDRLYVMNEGRFIAEMPTHAASQERIMAAIVNNGERAA